MLLVLLTGQPFFGQFVNPLPANVTVRHSAYATVERQAAAENISPNPPTKIPMTRLVKTLCATAVIGLGLFASGCAHFHLFARKPALASPAQPTVKKVLFFSKSSNFEHAVIKRKDGQPSTVEKVLAATGAKHGIEFTFSKDGSLFTPEYLAQFDAFMFYTSGDLLAPGKDGNPPMTAAGKQALLDAIKGGKGFIGVHSAADTFHTGETVDTNTNQARTWRYKRTGEDTDPYIRMLGGELIVHGVQQISNCRVPDHKFPGFTDKGDVLPTFEEWYSLTDFSHDLHVLLTVETDTMRDPDAAPGAPITDFYKPYVRPPYPSTWAHMYGQGRVFYTSLGHNDSMWWGNQDFQDILYGGIAWAVRNVDADVTPNIDQITPHAWDVPPVSKPVASAPKKKKAPESSTPTPTTMVTPPLPAATPATPEIKRPHILGISHYALYVHDIEKSRAFYKDFLGFDEPYTLYNKDGSLALTWIKINDYQTIELFPEKKEGSDRLYHIAILVDDAEAMRQYLASKGVKVPPKTPLGRTKNANYFIRDPDGHIVEVVQYMPDGWTMQDKGKHLPDTRISDHIPHGGVSVGELDTSLKFYRDILGFKEIWRGSVNGKTLNWVHMQVPDGTDFFELMLYAKLPDTQRLFTMHHFCLEVPDMEKAAAILATRKLPEGCKPPTEMKAGVNGKRQINYYDPDGTRVELMEPHTVSGQPTPSSSAPPPHFVPETSPTTASQ